MPQLTHIQFLNLPGTRVCHVPVFFLIFFNPNLWICLLISDRKGERDRQTNRHGCERETLIGCFLYAPQPGMEPST